MREQKASHFLRSPQFSRVQKAKNSSNGGKNPTETLATQAIFRSAKQMVAQTFASGHDNRSL